MGDSKIKIKSKYAKLSLSIFFAGLSLLVCYYILYNTGNVKGMLGKINDILTPFYMGIILAYLLCPIYNGTLRCVYRRNKGRFKNYVRDYRVARLVASLVSFIVLIGAIVGFFMLIIPELIESIIGIIGLIPDILDKVTLWINENIVGNDELVSLLQGRVDNIFQTLIDWGQNNVLPGAEAILSGVSVGIKGTFGAVLDIFVALVICIYVLNSKEIFQAQAKKMVLAIFSPKRADSIFEFGKICNDTFGGFINGKIIDSIIIGILCFIAMSIMKLPLAVLISVVVGVTNIIPFFGPFIGAVPSIILLTFINPVNALEFAIMVIILQQIDGNIIGPKILGKTTKLASFWVMFAILVGGGLFGFAGMILGVPTMAIIYVYLSRYINNKLVSKNLPKDTEIYENFDKYKINKEDIFGKEACVPVRGVQEGYTEEERQD